MADLSDTSPPASPVAPSAPETTAAEPSRGPLTIMRGGTLSSATEAAIAAHMADTQKRWAEQDNDVQRARDGEAVRRTVDMGLGATHPQVVLYFDLGGDNEGYIQADVVVDAEGFANLVLICPRCVFERNLPQTMAQINIHQSNRAWHLDLSCQGDVFVDYDSDGNPVPITLAGRVECEEKCRCPNVGCDYKFRISGGKQATAGLKPGCSRLVREY